MKIIQANIKRTVTHSKLDLESLKVGDYLVFDVYIKRDNNYFIIIEKGYLLTEVLYEKLKKQDDLYVLKEDLYKQKLACESLKYYVASSANDIKKILEHIYAINNTLFVNYLNSENNKIDIKCVKELINVIVDLMFKDKKSLKKMIPNFLNEYELKYHSLHVAIYAIALGISQNLNRDEVIKLGIAGLLHDIGMKKIDEYIIKKNNKLTLEELDTIHQHPKYSVEIVKHNQILDPYIIDAIMHHHENQDGSGYPDSLYKNRISEFASILSIADVFDALTNTRSTREAYNSFKALSIMMKDESMVNKFNKKYLHLFLKSL